MANAVMNTDYAEAKIVIGSYTFLSSEYNINSISIKTGCYDGSVVGIGCAYTTTCSINMEAIDAVVIGTQFEVFFKLNGEWKTQGKFWVNAQPIVHGQSMVLEAHGMLGAQGNTPYYDPDIFYTNGGVTIGSAFAGITELSDMSIAFDTDADVSTFLAQPISIPVKDEYFGGWDIAYYATHHGITKKEFLSGIAALFGGNVSERNGIIYFIPKTPDLTRERYTFSADSYGGDFEISKETYGIHALSISYTPTRYIGYFDSDPSVIVHTAQCYSGTDKATKYMLVSQAENNANVKYDQTLECDWVGYAASNTNGCYMQGDLTYRKGHYEFIGYNEHLYAGNIINIADDDGNITEFYIGEMTIDWDGGISTKVSCDCTVDVTASSVTSSTSSSAAMASVSSSATNSYNKIAFADITFSNVKDSTIRGSIFIDGTIAGSKIEDSAITDSKIANSSISGSKFIDGTIEGSKISDSAITESKISDSAITGSKISDSAITDSKIVNGTITGTKFVDGTITGSKIADATITNSLIANATLTGAKIKDAEIGFEKVNTSFITDLTADSAYITDLTAKVATLGYLQADMANLDTADIDKANIGLLFNAVGLIDDATIVDGHITGFLDSVEVNANKITTGSLTTDRLIIRGSTDSIIYEMNNITGALQSQSFDTLNGEILTDRTINCDKIVAGSITTGELNTTEIFSNSAVINKIFAQSIVATGSITGASLYGTYAEIESGIIAGYSIYADRLEHRNGLYSSCIYNDGIVVGYGVDDLTTLNRRLSMIDEDGVELNSRYITVYLKKDGNGDTDKDDYGLTFHHQVPGTNGSRTYNYISKARYTLSGISCEEYFVYNDGEISETTSEFSIDATTCSFLKNVDIGGTIKVTGKATLSGSLSVPSITGLGYPNVSSITAGTDKCGISGKNNIDISSWYGLSFSSSCDSVNKGQVAVSIDCRYGDIYARRNIYEAGTKLSNKYAVVKTGTKSSVGTGAWIQYTVSFGVTYATQPFVNVMPTSKFSGENINFDSFIGDSTNGYTGFYYSVYTPTTSFTYGTRWFATGIVK